MNKGETNHNYIHKITKVDFCGKPLAVAEYQEYRNPFPVESTEGAHNLQECGNCKKNIETLTERLTRKFKGLDENKQPFPDCCEGHQKLKTLPSYNYEAFVNVPEWVAQKVIYTNVHVENYHAHSEWYKQITHYIDHVISSFGSPTKGCGEPLYLGDYFGHIVHMIRNNNKVPQKKRAQILKFIEGYRTRTEKVSVEYLEIIRIYERWINAFPFKLTLFKPLKEHYEANIPLMRVENEVNIYSGERKSMLHSKETLTETLLTTTKEILAKFQAPEIVTQIDNYDQLDMDLFVASHQLEIDNLLGSYTKGEIAYRELLEKWLKGQSKFFNGYKHKMEKLLGKSNRLFHDSGSVIDFSEFEGKENTFFKPIPLAIVAKHFLVFTKLNKRGEPYLTNEELIRFLYKGFRNEVDLPKVTFNCAQGEKGKIIKRFYELFDLAVSKYGMLSKKEPFIQLIQETVDNGWTPESIVSYFRPNRSNHSW